jgi:hypothetical protein
MERMVARKSLRSSPWHVLWLLEKAGAAKSSFQGGAARASIRGVFGRSAARERRLVTYLRRGVGGWEAESNRFWEVPRGRGPLEALHKSATTEPL